MLERILKRVTIEELNTSTDVLSTIISEMFDHKNKLNSFTSPVLIMHTRQDTLIPLYHAENNYKSCGGAKELLIFEQGDHNTILIANWPDYVKALSNFIEKL